MESKRTLLSRRSRIVRSLPPLEELVRGSLVERHLRCGKPYCHCAKGEGHHVFYLVTSFGRGSTEQITVPVDLVPIVRRWIVHYDAWWDAVEEISAVNRDLLRNRWLGEETVRRGRR